MHGFGNGFYDCFYGIGRYGNGGPIMMIIGLLLIGAVIYLLFKNKEISGTGTPRETPLDLLQKRYVNGEISQEEYREKKEILSQK